MAPLCPTLSANPLGRLGKSSRWGKIARFLCSQSPGRCGEASRKPFQCAEHMAAFMASKLVSPSLPLRSDCLSGVLACAQTVTQQLSHRKYYAGIRRLDILTAGPQDAQTVAHVSAHRTLDQMQELEANEKRAAYGNFHADLAAKAALARCHKPPSRGLDSAVQQQAQ